MDLVILFDWFTNESTDAALQATDWQQRVSEVGVDVGNSGANSAAKKHRPRRRLTQHRVDRRPRELQHATVG